MERLSEEDHVGAVETANCGLEQYRSLEKDLRHHRDLATEIIDSYREEISGLFEQTRSALAQNHFITAREHLESVDVLIDREAGTVDLRSQADVLRVEADRVADDHHTRLEQADGFRQRGKFRPARDIVLGMINDFSWDEQLPNRIDQINAGMKQIDELDEQMQDELAHHHFQLVLEMCQRVRTIEPDHPHVEQFEQQAQRDEQDYEQAMRRIQGMFDDARFSQALTELRSMAERYSRDETVATEQATLEARLEAIELFKQAMAGRRLVQARDAWKFILDKGPEDRQAQAALRKLQPLVRRYRRRWTVHWIVLTLVVLLVGGGLVAVYLINRANGQYLSRARVLIAEGNALAADGELQRMWPILDGDRSALID